MKIIEVRDGFIKFEADNNVYLSSFIQAEGTEKKYIAQVNQLKRFGDISIANAKILFIFKENSLFNYDKTEPSKDAEISLFPLNILKETINIDKPVIIGKTADNSNNITIDYSAFNKKMLISVDNSEMNNTLVKNLSKQFENIDIKTIIIDTLGIISAKKYTAGKDFKLPLNTETLAFMYKSCLDDATDESKAAVSEVFKELAEYSRTVPFVPFEMLKDVVDDMVDKQHLFKLFVLKNKLAKFHKLGYFASSEKEVDSLSEILNSNCAIIDLSGLDAIFQNRYLEFLYEKLENLKNVQVLLEISNTISKKNLKLIFSDSNVSTTLISHSKFQYLRDMQNIFDNFIIEPSFNNNDIFKIYKSFFNSMESKMYLSAGEALNYIPTVSVCQQIDEVMEWKKEEFEEIAAIENDEEAFEEQINENIMSDSEQIEDSDITINEDSSDMIDSLEQEIVESELSEDILEQEKEEEETQEIEEEIVQEQVLSEEEIISAINAKSDNVIESIANDINDSKELKLFEEEMSDSNDNGSEDENTSLDIIEEDNNFNEESLEDSEAYNFESVESDETIVLDEMETEDSSQEVLESDNNSLNISDENIELSENSFDSNLTDDLDKELYVDDNTNENIEIVELGSDNLDDINLLSDENEQESVNNDLIPEESDETVIELNEEESLLTDESDIEDFSDNNYSELENNESFEQEPQIIPIENNVNDDFGNIMELDSDETQVDDIIVDLSDEEENINIDEKLDQQIVEDVDKVYTTMKESDELEEISDSDLDLIDELNNGEELEEYNGQELEELSDKTQDDSILEEYSSEQQNFKTDEDEHEILEKRDSSTPIVPVYDADIPQEDMVSSDPIQQGDAVVHTKYGNGVVEKMIKYGNKTLFAINFENIGRRLLDPMLTEIKRV